MLEVKFVIVDDKKCKVKIHSSVIDSVTMTGRVVKMDFGTVGMVERKNVELKKGLNTLTFSLIIPNEQPAGEYAIYLDTVSSTEDSFLSDDGPYNFIKESNAE